MLLQGDCFELLQKRFVGRAQNIVIFASPPWGGVNYKDTEIFDLSTMEPYNLKTLYEKFTKFSPDVALYLPRSSNLNQVARYAKDEEQLQVVHYCAQGASKVSVFVLSSSDPLLTRYRPCACTMAIS